jgi:hypothetical protein
VNYDFYVQASNPRSLRVFDEADTLIEEAMQSVFPMWTEDAYMVWDGVRVPLGYKYTLSLMLSDVLTILERLMQHKSGSMTSHWPVQEFAAIWHLRWHEAELEIQAEWNTAPCGLQALLAAHPTLIVDKAAFISEWKQILGVVLEALTQAGYREDRLVDLARLREVHAQIHEYGVLYREPSEEAPAA